MQYSSVIVKEVYCAGTKGTISRHRLPSTGSFTLVNGKDREGGGEREEITLP